jgi:hypothetical protein
MLQDRFDHEDWDRFRVATENKRKRIEDVVPTVTISTYPNQKPSITGYKGTTSEVNDTDSLLRTS